MNLSEWLDELMPAISGAEVALVQRHIILGAIDFCEMSWVWHKDAVPLNIVVDQSKYNLVSPVANTEIVQVLVVYVDNENVEVSSWNVLNANYAKAKTLKGYAIAYVQDYVEELTLFQIPDVAITNGLAYKVAMRPTRNATTIDDSIGKRYFDGIADAAKARLFEIPNKPWSDGQAAVFYKQKSEEAARAAKDEVLSGLGRGARRTKTLFY